jgi:uncharacterized phage-associated protein
LISEYNGFCFGVNKMPSVEDVAEWVVDFSKKHGDPVTNLKLQKLLYYAQAWYLALNDEPLFPEDIEAWVYGPVVPEVYQSFKENGAQPIKNDVDPPQLSEKLQDHLEEVLEVFGGYSSFQLEQMTHQEDPWKNARGDLPPDEPSNEKISHEDMKRYYRQLIED